MSGENMEKEKISVVIPTYNREKSILASVNSVLNQSYKNLEVIVVDDGSKDKTEELIKTIDDPRLKYIKLDGNHGACYARNVGIKESTGKYIAFQDSDDTFREEKLEIQLKHLKECKSDLDFNKFMKHINNNQENVFPDFKIVSSKGWIVNKLCERNIVSTQTILAKREIFNEILFDESLPRLQDYDLVLRIAQKYSISYTDEILSDIYLNDDNISNDASKLKKAIMIMIKKDYFHNEEQNEKITDMFIRTYVAAEPDEKYIEYKKMCDSYKLLEKEYEAIKKDYNQIVNSKRWKMMGKIFKK